MPRPAESSSKQGGSIARAASDVPVARKSLATPKLNGQAQFILTDFQMKE
jgi:hypothetical protein